MLNLHLGEWRYFDNSGTKVGEEFRFFKRHGFCRAEFRRIWVSALAAEGILILERQIPSRVKARRSLSIERRG
jgi:hypothetical protein